MRADRVSGTEYRLQWTSHIDSGGGKIDRENVFEGVQRIELLEQQPLIARQQSRALPNPFSWESFAVTLDAGGGESVWFKIRLKDPARLAVPRPPSAVC